MMKYRIKYLSTGSWRTLAVVFCMSMLLEACDSGKTLEVRSDDSGKMKRYARLIPTDMDGTKFDRLVYDCQERKASYYIFFRSLDARYTDIDSLQAGLRDRVIDNIRTIPDMLAMAEDGMSIEYLFMDRSGVLFYEQAVEPNIYRLYVSQTRTIGNGCPRKW